MALHTPSLRTPVATHHILGWMVGAVALVAVLSIGLVVISRPSAAPSTATAQGVAITQGAAAVQAYQEFRRGEREALNAPQLATQAYLAYRAGERVGPADEAQAATQAWLSYRADERLGAAEQAQAATQAWLNYRAGERQ
jgi:hypothetical protein